jgi:hypothetical protein
MVYGKVSSCGPDRVTLGCILQEVRRINYNDLIDKGSVGIYPLKQCDSIVVPRSA